jgi:predicted PurR-regulated permease PerM
VVGIVLFIPVALALHQFAQESQALLQSLSHFRQNGIPVPEWLSKLPGGEHGARWWTANLGDPNGAVEWLGGKTNRETDIAWTRSLGAQLAHRVFLFFVALVGVFVLLRDGAWIGNRVLESADRLLGDPGERLASKMVDTVRGIVSGTVVVAVSEGLFIGLAYVFAGVPNPLLFSLLTMAFAMVPLGAWVVFSGAALLLLLQGGSVFGAAGVFGFGALVMLVGDFLVWPALVGNQARLPFLLALIGIFGGVQAFGLVGLFLGPIVLAALWTVWREWVVPPATRSPPR